MDYRRANKILKLTNAASAKVQNHKEISTLLTSHFKQIAQETQEDRTTAIMEITQAIPKSITTEKNMALLRKISLEEVEEAVRSMPNDKAPGPDGFTIFFSKLVGLLLKQRYGKWLKILVVLALFSNP